MAAAAGAAAMSLVASSGRMLTFLHTRRAPGNNDDVTIQPGKMRATTKMRAVAPVGGRGFKNGAADINQHYVATSASRSNRACVNAQIVRLKEQHGYQTRGATEGGASVNQIAPDEEDDAPYVPGGPIKNACIVVTGANRGIGLEFVRQLLAKSKGNSVIAACRDAEGAEDLMHLQLEVGPERLAITSCDVSDENSVGYWASSLKVTQPVVNNGGVVDVVINNAGTTGTEGFNSWELEDITSDEMVYVFKINTVGPLLVVQQLLKYGFIGGGGKGGGGGALVGNVTSKVGSVEDNSSGKGYAYRASKSALNIVNKSMSVDLADRGVLCALLHPGWVRTRMTEGRGLIDADESASGLIKALEGEYGEINGRWYDYKGDEIPW